MDNTTTNNPALNKPCSTITLDSYQYQSYQQGWLKIHSPDGTPLETLGHLTQKDTAQTDAFNLKNEIHLLEYLFLNINSNIELPVEAIFGLVDIFNRMRNFCDKHAE